MTIKQQMIWLNFKNIFFFFLKNEIIISFEKYINVFNNFVISYTFI